MPRQTSERYTPLSIPSFIAETRFSEQGLRLLTRRAPETRRINYLARLLTEDSAAKEIKLFNLGGNLLGRYTSLFEKFFQEDKSLATRRAAVGFGLGLIATLGFYGSYAWIVWRTVQGSISLGDMTLYPAIFRHFQQLTDGKMAILISHRFSTVRMAQRIVVLQGGRIAEIGSHEELLERQCVYARLFHMQAEGYR